MNKGNVASLTYRISRKLEMNKNIVSKLLLGLFLIVSPFAYGTTTTFTGDSDVDKFADTDYGGGTVVYAADSFTWSTPQFYGFGGQDLPAAAMGAGDFEYRIDLEDANVLIGDLSFVAAFDDPDAADGRAVLHFGDVPGAGTLCVFSNFFGTEGPSDCGRTVPTSLRLALSGTMLSVSYSCLLYTSPSPRDRG